MKIRRTSGTTLVGALAVLFAGCGSSDLPSSSSESLENAAFAVTSDAGAASDAQSAMPALVQLDEFTVRAARPWAKAGMVRFQVLNKGDEEHEFVIVRTDLAIEDLPTNDDGSFDEEGAGVEVIDEIEDIEPGTMARITVSLEAGHYVLLCNRVEVEEDGEIESHFEEGMHTDFTVR